MFLDCITKSWFLFEERDQIRPGDAPYNASYIEDLHKSVLLSRQALAMQETESPQENSDVGGQEADPSFARHPSRPTEAESRVQPGSIPVELVLETRRTPAPDADRGAPESFEHYVSTSIGVQRDSNSLEDNNYVKNTVDRPEDRIHPDPTQTPASSASPSISSSWTDLEHGVEQKPNLFDVLYGKNLPNKYLPNNNPNELERSNALVHSEAARTECRLSSGSVTKIQENLLLPLLQKPSLQKFKPVLSFCSGVLYTMRSLRDVEQFLLATAVVS